MTLSVSVLNNACFLIEVNGIKILVDPYVSKKKLMELSPNFVIVSHGHIDHALHLRHLDMPIYGNKFVAKSMPSGINIEDKSSFYVDEVEVFPVSTSGHPHILQNNFLYDLVTYPFTGIMRCGKNFGFVFKHMGKTVYYTSDTLYNEDLFKEIEEEHHPQLILCNVQPSVYIPPKLIMTKKESSGLKDIFQGEIVHMHAPLKKGVQNTIKL